MTRDDLLAALTHDNVAAFLRLIRQGESSQDEQAYRWLFGSTYKNPKLFDSFADHPRVRTYEKYDGQFIKNGKIDYTTAAGAYQITETTWNGLVKQYQFTDFSPATQDQAAVALIAGRGALDDVLSGRLYEAIQRTRQEWASMPGAAFGRQPTQALAKAREVFAAYGGRETPTPVQSPSPQVVAVPHPPKVTMAPLVIPILSVLSSVIPQLGALFGSGSEVANRNIAAGSILAQKITEVTQSVNLQEAAEKIQSDPQALQAAKEAVADVMFQLSEAGGGGIEGARKAAASADQPPFWKQGAFWISLLLIVMPFMLLADVFYVHPDSYDSNLRTQIVTAILMVIGMVGAFWLGTSFGSQRKDALLAARS